MNFPSAFFNRMSLLIILLYFRIFDVLQLYFNISHGSVVFIYSALQEDVILVSGALFFFPFHFSKYTDVYIMNIHFYDDFLILIIP